ncbi:stealth conserved region 3 domain-containing protein [Arthrobacter sp. NPDC055138]
MIAGLRGTLARVLPQPAVQGLFDLRHGRTSFQRRAADVWRSAQTRPARAGVDADVVPASSRGRTVLTKPVRRFCARDVATSNRQLVASAARGAGIGFGEEASGPHGGTRISVAPGDLSELLDAVRRTGTGRAVYVSVDGGRPQLARDAVVDVPREVTVFEFASADGLVLADERLGCTVSALPAAGGAGRPMTEFTEPVDLVYTWVDGADAEWRRARDAAWARIHPGELNEFAGNEERFRTHDELRYSLRSVDYFAPWANHIYLLTAGQVPEWLDKTNPRITVVDHRDVFADADALPTFNSHAIEAQLHRIPGLSEHFLYLNDDVFFGRPVAPELFFHGNGIAKFFFSEQRVADGPAGAGDLPVDSAAKRNRALIEQKFGKSPVYKFKHAAHAQRVSTLRLLEQDFQSAHTATAHARFRTPADISIPSSLAHYYGYGIGAAVPGEIAYRYCDIGESTAQAKLLRLLRDREADVFCLNEVGKAAVHPEDQEKMVQRFLQSYYPVPSSFEVGM